MPEFLIETPRTRIRAWRDDDRAAFAQMVADTEMMRYVSAGRVWNEDEIDEFFARQAHHLASRGFCMGALVLKETDRVIGVAGMQPLDLDDEIELGWWIWKEYWGSGYAREAIEHVIRHGREVFGLRRLVAVIVPGNAASIRVAERLGMRFERQMPARETQAARDDSIISLYGIEDGEMPVHGRDARAMTD